MPQTRDLNRDLSTCAALGAMAGMRSLLPQAIVSDAVSRNAARLPQPLRQLATDSGVRLLSAAALMELVGDKLPGIPARISLVPLLGRVLSGALSGFVTARQWRYDARLFAGIGAASALIAAYSSYHARRILSSRLGISGMVSGLLEDGVALLCARWVKRRLV